MAPLKVERYIVGPVQTNCYFAVNEQTKETLIQRVMWCAWCQRQIIQTVGFP